MTKKPTVNLVYEFNCYEAGSKASIWIVPYRYDPDEDEYDDIGVKVIGPVSLSAADEIKNNLQLVFDKLGYEVVISEAADD